MPHGLSKTAYAEKLRNLCRRLSHNRGSAVLLCCVSAQESRASARGPKYRLHLPVKFLLTPANLSHSLQCQPAKLAPCPRQAVGHITHGNAIFLRKALIRNISLEIVSLKEPKGPFFTLFHR